MTRCIICDYSNETLSPFFISLPNSSKRRELIFDQHLQAYVCSVCNMQEEIEDLEDIENFYERD